MAMPDTRRTRRCIRNPAARNRGWVFRCARMVGLICLGSGAVLDAAIGGYRGKGNDEQTLLRPCSIPWRPVTCCSAMPISPRYFLLCALRERGVEAVFEQQGARRRSTDFRRGERLGARDHLIELRKACPQA